MEDNDEPAVLDEAQEGDGLLKEGRVADIEDDVAEEVSGQKKGEEEDRPDDILQARADSG